MAVTVVSPSEGFKHLGIFQSTGDIWSSTIAPVWSTLKSEAERISRLQLSHRQLQYIVNHGWLPRVQYRTQLNVSHKVAKHIDILVRRTAEQVLRLLHNTPKAVFHDHNQGLGLASFEDMSNVARIELTLRAAVSIGTRVDVKWVNPDECMPKRPNDRPIWQELSEELRGRLLKYNIKYAHKVRNLIAPTGCTVIDTRHLDMPRLDIAPDHFLSSTSLKRVTRVFCYAGYGDEIRVQWWHERNPDSGIWTPRPDGEVTEYADIFIPVEVSDYLDRYDLRGSDNTCVAGAMGSFQACYSGTQLCDNKAAIVTLQTARAIANGARPPYTKYSNRHRIEIRSMVALMCPGGTFNAKWIRSHQECEYSDDVQLNEERKALADVDGDAARSHDEEMPSWAILEVPTAMLSEVFFAFVVMICLLWTLLLITLNLAPNHTVNLVMRTETFDDGSFWLFVVPSPSVLMLAVCGLSAVALGYVVVLAKMIIRPIQVAPELATKIPVNSSSEMLLSSTKLGPSRLKTKGVSRHGAMEFLAVRASARYGYVRCIYLFTTEDVAEVLTNTRSLYLFRFDVVVAVGCPMLVLVYCLNAFTFPRDKLAINRQVFPSGWFEQQASVIADPVQTAVIYKSLKSLRITSVFEFFARMGVPATLFLRLRQVVELLKHPSK
ncbi:hypothetical protein PHYSODRAFT_295736 [Phytophthora sojae]|uniref:Uncharacterized protein n=1 Tax=Phytophthora sojae (strain P6497) TaxID=1094619 RepID=G4YYB0_PHYSP|nr:hypothetical protein PHYSODRAFT_295736 [Phytophthora sojae]EGZ23261.1 hypothetical protein PHYSODRAFT_295736 [Phytophthora sojae]|eukprot:XP_009518549.1 hypothetical protein PHYSODRAFT_295736 [Phytophthora sojae]